MGDRIALLVGTRKGAFVLESDARRQDWSVRGPLCEGMPIHDIVHDPATGGRTPQAAARGTARRVRIRRPAAHLDAVERGPRVRRRQRPGDHRLEPGAGERDALRGRGAGGPLPKHRPRRDVGTRHGAHRAPHAPSGCPATAGSSSTRSSPTPPTTTGCGSASPRSGCSRRMMAARPGRRATRESAPTSTPGRRPNSASASTSSRSPPVSRSICTSRTTAACIARSTAGRRGRRSRACRRTSGSSWQPIRATRRWPGPSR